MKYIIIVLGLFLALSLDANVLSQYEKEGAKSLDAHPDSFGVLSPGMTRVYMFTPTSDGTVDIYTTGSSDTFGFLYLSDTDVLEEDDIDMTNNRNFSFENISVERGKKYYVAVQGYQNDVSGNFRIHFVSHYKDQEESSTTQWKTGKFTNNETRKKSLEVFWATSLKVVIYGSTEATFDYVTIKDQNGNIKQKLTGDIDKEFIVSGSKITVELSSDSSVQSDGVTVTIAENDGQELQSDSKQLDVLALKQRDYQFEIDGVDYSVIGCVPSTYAMMIDYYAKQRNDVTLDIETNIKVLMQLYSDNDILRYDAQDESTGVLVTDEGFVDLLSHQNMAFSNHIHMVSYTLSLERMSAYGWSYDDFMLKAKQNINQNKPIAVSVVILEEKAGWFGRYYEVKGGHHMLLTGYGEDNTLVFNDTWSHSPSSWSKVDFNDNYKLYNTKGDTVFANDYSINTNIAFTNGSYIAVVRTHSASFNVPQYVNFYQF